MRVILSKESRDEEKVLPCQISWKCSDFSSRKITPLRDLQNSNAGSSIFRNVSPENIQNDTCGQSQKQSQIESNDLKGIECSITIHCQVFLLRLVFVSVWRTSEA